MNAAHLHLIFNHAGIFGVLFSTVLLAAGLMLKIPVLRRSAMIGFVAAAVATAITMNSGEGAEEVLENAIPLNESVIEAHEDAAQIAAWLTGIAGLISLAGLILFLRNRTAPALLDTLLLVIAVAATVSIVNTGRLGGKIRHTEITDSAPVPASPGADDDDD